MKNIFHSEYKLGIMFYSNSHLAHIFDILVNLKSLKFSKKSFRTKNISGGWLGTFFSYIQKVLYLRTLLIIFNVNRIIYNKYFFVDNIIR